MRLTPLPEDIMERLAAHRTVGQAPTSELEWLVARGCMRHAEPGDCLGGTGQLVEDSDLGLEVILKGSFTTWVTRGGARRKAMEWRPGDISGLLPFSRMRAFSNETVADTTVECFTLDRQHFPELIRECPTVTALCVHMMVDRARVFKTSDLQDEKMASLGKLSAGLAHELNNPASAVARSAALLQQAMAEADRAARALALVGLDEGEIAAVERLRDACMDGARAISLTPLERADREDEIAEWLDARGLDQSALESLAESSVALEHLDELAEHLSGQALDAALDWVAAGCTVRTLASESERAGARISELVRAMKRLTHMDQAPTPAPVDVEQGLRDTLLVLGHKARAKSIGVRIDVAPDLPRVHAVGGELDQVWMNLIDNALDAVDVGGRVSVTAKPEGWALVVRVVDDGPGIAPDDQSRIFDPFFTTKAPGEGTGLGLEIARTQVRAHGGDIEFDSRPGRTEFRVALPLRQATPSTTPGPAEPPSTPSVP